MGRPELPVDPAAGPVERLAHDLRELRRSAGGVSYRTMAKKAGFSVTTLAKAASGERLPSLAVFLAYVQACGADPVPWEARWAEAEALAGEERQEAADAVSPYCGLARFEPDDRELFFGRDRLIDDLSKLGCAASFAVVFGASGSGKSSLLRAGLIPLLQERIAQQGHKAVLRILTPGARPAATYGHLLTPKADDPESWVVVDQFEEVYTLCRERAERDRFLDLLLAARDPGSRLRVLIAVRSDFYARCAEHPRLAEALHGSGLLVRPMTADELREAVIGPAQAAGLIVERTLTARIVEDVLDEPGGLPMLSHALLETWRRRNGRMLTLAAYEAAGGVRGAIAATAEEAYGELSPAQAHAARHLLLRMVEPGQGNADTRRPITWEEMAGWEDPEVRAVTGRLTQARLLTTDDDGVQLAHEALITCWPRLREWVEADRERLRHHRQLTDAARTWLEHDRDAGTLYRGTRLARAEELFAGDDRGYDGLTSEERAFLVTAAEQRATEERAATRARRRSRTLTASLCAVLAVALVVGLTAVRLRQDSEKQTTDTAARRVAAVADALRTTDPRTAMLLGVAAWRLSPLPESRRALLGALAQPELDSFTDPAPGDEPARFLDSSGRTLLSTSDNTTWRRWDVDTHRRIASGPVPRGAVLDAGPGGRVLLISASDTTQQLWDTRAGRWIGGPLPLRYTVRFGAGGRNYLVTSLHDDRAGLYSLTDGHLVFRTPPAGGGGARRRGGRRRPAAGRLPARPVSAGLGHVRAQRPVRCLDERSRRLWRRHPPRPHRRPAPRSHRGPGACMGHHVGTRARRRRPPGCPLGRRERGRLVSGDRRRPGDQSVASAERRRPRFPALPGQRVAIRSRLGLLAAPAAIPGRRHGPHPRPHHDTHPRLAQGSARRGPAQPRRQDARHRRTHR
ncbi:DNA-binding helix-turn-helix protein [Streptomyces turgidiscabies Car8]|uniref:DNA-binding helix-turn-helix protein n=1 Tax=Streptomyces turgidiscabies (strain Car8) TaxID=698760 RepID=L7F4X5_STRT8|nr:helix-turn-helix domain-containing protein [Streptomyces turgidiscabies]ELP66628.1 DNA-binding helix-turn-helix protein [Streptomyces turgidiscabies Car8]GAQ71446.1 hypothetical protein T45_03188 [Streptomyces turgidiscabies]